MAHSCGLDALRGLSLGLSLGRDRHAKQWRKPSYIRKTACCQLFFGVGAAMPSIMRPECMTGKNLLRRFDH